MKFSTAALLLAVAAAPTSQAFVPSSFGVVRRTPSPFFKTSFLTSTTEDVSDKLMIEEISKKVKSVKTAQKHDSWQTLNHHSVASARENALSYLKQYEGQNGASIIYSKLQENAVTVVNGFSGGAVLPLLDQFHEGHPRHGEPGAPKPIRWITNSNESSAGHIAEGYAKSVPVDMENLPVGVVVATSGPGVTNLITPLQDAICDGVPMVVLCGQAATVAPQDAFQACPAVDLTRPCTKWSYQIKSAAELPMVMDYAFFIARNGRPGPVFVDLPKDLQNQVLTADIIKQFADRNLVAEAADTENSFVRFEENARVSGEKFQAFALGYHGKGLPFEIAKDGSRFKLKPVSYFAGNDDNIYHADHHPTNKIFFKHEGKIKDGTLEIGSPMTTQMVRLISRAKKPVIIAGQGCNDSPEELKAFAERLRIPVTTTLHALGCFDERHDLALNMLGMHGHPTPNFMVQESDLIICIGSRFDDRITGRMADFVPEARKAAEEGRGGIIHVDIRLTENAKQVPPTFFVHSSAKTFLRTINEMVKTSTSRPATDAWLAKKRNLQRDFPVKIPYFPTTKVSVTGENGETITLSRTRISAQSVVFKMDQLLLDANKMDDCIFTTGVGVHQMVAAQLITWTQPRQMLSSGSLGTMGVSLGYSIGAKLANGKKLVISVDGDGSFNMTFTELKTVAEQKIAIKILLMDNNGQMMVEYWQRLFHDNRLLAVRNSHNPDYVMLAQAFGIKSIYCDCEEELEEKMKEFLFTDPDEPVLFHVAIERTPCLPLVAPGQPLEDMIMDDVDVEVDPGAAPS